MYKIIKYPDKTGYVKVDSSFTETIRLNTYEDFWYLNQIVDAKNNMNIRPLITIPCLIDGQADRRFAIDEPAALKLILQSLNSMDADFTIFHPHNPELVEGMLDNVKIVDNEGFIKEVVWNINGNYPKDNIYISLNKDSLVLMSSDAGGFKPLIKLCDKINWKGETFSASKSRKYVEGKSKLTQQIDKQDFEGKDILIIDDICVYGGTFKGLAKMLRERNCGKLYLAVSHLTIQNHKGDDTIFKYFDKVFTTNSKFDEYFIEDSKGEQVKPDNLLVINQFKPTIYE